MGKKRLCIIIVAVVVTALPAWCFAENVATPAVTSDIYDVGVGEQFADNLEELAEMVESSDDFNFVQDPLLTVVVPADLDFFIDPFRLGGRGQIYSKNFVIQNYGDKDVIVKLENIKYTFVNDTDFASLDAPPEIPFGIDNAPDLKEVYMLIHYENKNLEDFVITTKEKSETADILLCASEYDADGNFVSLNEESSFVFNFIGMVNHMSEIEWQDKDFTVSISYTMLVVDDEEVEEPVIPEDEETLEPEEASGEETSETTQRFEPQTAQTLTEEEQQTNETIVTPDTSSSQEGSSKTLENVPEKEAPEKPDDSPEAEIPQAPPESSENSGTSSESSQ